MFELLDRSGVKKDWEKTMARNPSFKGAQRVLGRNTSSMACLAFVAVLGLAFWAGALWIGQLLMSLSGL